MKFQFVVALLTFGVLFACAQNNDSNLQPAPTPPKPAVVTKAMAPGKWGGEHIELSVTDSGGSVKLDCGEGVIEQKIFTDSLNRFDVKGYVLVVGGPVTADNQAIRLPAHFQGTIQGDQMNLNLTYLSVNQTVSENYQLNLGAAPHFGVCQVTPTPLPSPAPSSSPTVVVATGQWGGRGIDLNITDAGGNYILDCAHGEIDQTIKIDSQGRFSNTGTIVVEHGGPVMENEPEDRRPAKYEGVVIGDAMSMQISYPPDVKVSYSLAYGQTPRIFRCR